MYGDADRILELISGTVEKRVAAQLNRHMRVNPRVDRRKIIDLQIEDERKRMRGALERIEAYDATQPLDDWLLFVAKQMKGGR